MKNVPTGRRTHNAFACFTLALWLRCQEPLLEPFGSFEACFALNCPCSNALIRTFVGGVQLPTALEAACLKCANLVDNTALRMPEELEGWSTLHRQDLLHGGRMCIL